MQLADFMVCCKSSHLASSFY